MLVGSERTLLWCRVPSYLPSARQGRVPQESLQSPSHLVHPLHPASTAPDQHWAGGRALANAGPHTDRTPSTVPEAWMHMGHKNAVMLLGPSSHCQPLPSPAPLPHTFSPGIPCSPLSPLSPSEPFRPRSPCKGENRRMGSGVIGVGRKELPGQGHRGLWGGHAS